MFKLSTARYANRYDKYFMSQDTLRTIYLLIYLLTYLLTYILHGAETLLRR